MSIIRSFFDKNYQTPAFLQKKQQNRRSFLKSAAGASAMAALPVMSLTNKQQVQLNERIKTDPWLTLNATLNHLLPSSATGPSATDIQATAYLFQVITVQPTEQDEKDFILKGVGWLNDYANSQKSKPFALLNFADKEQLLQSISRSRAGENWLNTLLGYIFQAMLAPPSYGGNPNNIGYQWLEHQAGFPIPKEGQRYYELPKRARIDLVSPIQYQQKGKMARRKKPNSGIHKA
ncbi:gluconate 2-dehydrogenase subunit 3 family protein [Colwelliaceae bacterium MEBiC 14330]